MQKSIDLPEKGGLLRRSEDSAQTSKRVGGKHQAQSGSMIRRLDFVLGLSVALLALLASLDGTAAARNFLREKRSVRSSDDQVVAQSLSLFENGRDGGDVRHKLIGAVEICQSPTSQKATFCIALNFLPDFDESTKFDVFGKNYTEFIQFDGLSVYKKSGHVLQMFGYQAGTGKTNILSFDVFSADMVLPPVELPIVSYAFIGLGIKMAYDPMVDRTIVTGTLPFKDARNTTHGFYSIDKGGLAHDLGFTLEDITPKTLWKGGYIEILGTRLGIYSPEDKLFWGGYARNNTETGKVDFLLLGIDVDEGALKKDYVFPIGDCGVLGALTWDPYNARILMPTFKTGTSGEDVEIIMGSFDPTEGTCKSLGSIDFLPQGGLMTFDTAVSDSVVTMLVEDQSYNASSSSSSSLGEEVLDTPEGFPMVVPPHLGRSAVSTLRSVETGEVVDVFGREPASASDEEGPVKPKPFQVINYDLSLGKITAKSHDVCWLEMAAMIHQLCPHQLEWAV